MLDGRRSLARAGVFVALIGLEIYLARSMSTPSIRGYIDSTSYGVSSAQKGIVRKIDVSLGQSVTAGQVIAELDASGIENQMATKMAERKAKLSALRTPAGSASADDATDALHVVDSELEALAEQRDALRLKAPADGVIESLDVNPGDTVTASTPVATIVAADTRRVVACIPEGRLDDVQIGSVASVQPAVGGTPVPGAVESLTPAVAPLPERCQPPFAKRAQLGRVAVVRLDAPAPALPGQSELVEIGATKRAVVAPDSPSHAEAAHLIDVPPEIVSITRFEASGLVWVAGLDRYVVVSDETGLDGKQPPWLFTMSRRGVVDPEPLVIEDLKQIDDVESIAAGDAGALWILASNSVSQGGNRPHAREVLAHLSATPTGYRADGKAHLASLLEAADPALRRTLGITDVSALDIEGLAYRKGALYIGLKAPVDASGRAMIWRVAAPDKLLAGDLAGAGVTVWGTLELHADVDGRPVTGGIADMIFVSDTTLLVGATASGISAKHQSGALYVVSGTGGKLSATQVHVFPELRPEGIALAPDAHRLAVVFDRGRDAPMWLELDLPEGIDL